MLYRQAEAELEALLVYLYRPSYLAITEQAPGIINILIVSNQFTLLSPLHRVQQLLNEVELHLPLLRDSYAIIATPFTPHEYYDMI